ncbi:MAG: aminopeptidase, partial [Erythrobacter sp.]
ALLFSLATVTRSMLASYIGVMVLVLGYLTINIVVSSDPSLQSTVARYEPLGVGAIGEVSRYWTADDMNSRLIPLEGNLLFNRIFVLALAGLFLGFAWLRFSMTERAPSRWRQRRLAKQAARTAKAESVAPRALTAPVTRDFGFSHAAASFGARLKAEVFQVLKSPGLIVLLLLSLAFTGLNLAFSQTMYGTPSYPLTAGIITTVIGSMSLFTLIIAVFYGGELVWRERDVKIGEIIDATPVPAWAMFVPKIIAIFTVLSAMSLAGMLTGVLYQLAK